LDPQNAQVRAIQQIEQTLHQLGQMFSQFSVLVQRQGEQIERIDTQTEQTQSNIEGAQNELFKYYQSISGNRSLIMKLFGVTATFLVVFVMFF
jgi:syntaxin 5